MHEMEGFSYFLPLLESPLAVTTAWDRTLAAFATSFQVGLPLTETTSIGFSLPYIFNCLMSLAFRVSIAYRIGLVVSFDDNSFPSLLFPTAFIIFVNPDPTNRSYIIRVQATFRVFSGVDCAVQLCVACGGRSDNAPIKRCCCFLCDLQWKRPSNDPSQPRCSFNAVMSMLCMQMII